MNLAESNVRRRNSSFSESPLIDLDDAVDLGDEPEGGEESNSSGEKKENKGQEERVSEVENRRRRALDRQLRKEVVNAIEKEVDCGKAGGQEGSPPPMVILGAKMKVGQEDGSLGTRDDEDDKDEEEKAEHVIGLMRPNAVENEEELNEDAAEGEDAAHDDSRERARVDGLVGDLARDLVCPHGMLDRALLEAEIRADEGQRHGHTEPQCQQPHQCSKGDGGRRLLRPENQIHDEEDGEDDPGAKMRRQKHVRFPFLPAVHFVNTGRNVSCGRSEADVQDDDARHERASIGRREEAEAGEDEGDGHHDGDLGSVADEDGEEHPLLRRPEHVAVDQLPPKLLLGVFRVHLVVTRDVLVKRAQEDHGHHAGKEEDDDERVHDGKPLNVRMRHRIENIVPSGRPFDVFILGPRYAEGIRDLGAAGLVVSRDAHRRLGGRVSARFARFQAVVALGFDLNFDDASGGSGKDLTAPFRRLFRVVIGDFEVDMVEDVIRIGLIEDRTDHASVPFHALFRYVAADRESGGAVFVSAFRLVTPRNRHIVDDPMMLVVEHNSLAQEVELRLGRFVFNVVLLDANRLTRFHLAEGKIVGRRVDTFAENDLT